MVTVGDDCDEEEDKGRGWSFAVVVVGTKDDYLCVQ